jgi:uncharacterized membrane protein YoaK (UPF0700 family)
LSGAFPAGRSGKMSLTKGINHMSTESVTTPAGNGEGQINYVDVRNGLLNALTVSSGAVDAISFLALGKVFTAFMTGNFAFLGMAIASTTGLTVYGVVAPRAISVLAAMAGFFVGVFIATRIVRQHAPKNERATGIVWPERTTLALGFSLLAHLCFVLIWLVTSARPSDNVIPILLAVWGLAMGMQSGAVRKLDVGGTFTTAATATYIFLASNVRYLPLMSDERRRLRGIIWSLVIGATAGGLLLIHAPIYAPVLPLVITAVVVALAASTFRYDEEAQESQVKVHLPSDASTA